MSVFCGIPYIISCNSPSGTEGMHFESMPAVGHPTEVTIHGLPHGSPAQHTELGLSMATVGPAFSVLSRTTSSVPVCPWYRTDG